MINWIGKHLTRILLVIIIILLMMIIGELDELNSFQTMPMRYR